MLDLTETDRFAQTIKVEMPDKAKSGTIIAHYRMLGREQVNALAGESFENFLNIVLIGWEDLKSNGEDLPFNKENLARVADHPLLGALLVQSYLKALSGAALASVQVKN